MPRHIYYLAFSPNKFFFRLSYLLSAIRLADLLPGLYALCSPGFKKNSIFDHSCYAALEFTQFPLKIKFKYLLSGSHILTVSQKEFCLLVRREFQSCSLKSELGRTYSRGSANQKYKLRLLIRLRLKQAPEILLAPL